MKAVILAGGKGTRLKPYTTVFPKPLMPLNDKPILEIVIQQLKSHGFEEIIISVGYLAELIMTFLGEGNKFGIKIKYLREDKPMGTAGSLGLLKDNLNETFLIMNGDILTTLDFNDLISFHKNNGAIATIALNKREVFIDFGVLKLDKEKSVIEYVEKPRVNYLVSMGVCVLDPKALQYIKPNEYLDFPDLIKKMISNGENVKGYLHEGYWLDIGRPDDYEKANQEIEIIYDKLGLDPS